MRNRATQYESVFYILYKRFKEGKTDLLPVHYLMGEVFIKELNKWGYVSHECSARASEMHKENPGLLYREWMTGKSGARFYGYRIALNADASKIREPGLQAFYQKISGKKVPDAAKQMEDWWTKQA